MRDEPENNDQQQQEAETQTESQDEDVTADTGLRESPQDDAVGQDVGGDVGNKMTLDKDSEGS